MMMPGPPGGALISVQEALGLGPEPPKPLTAEEAEAAAEAEDLTLALSDKSATGFKSVGKIKNSARPYVARASCNGHALVLGCFATPQEAALVIARRHRRAEARAASDGTRGEKECPICLETLESTGGLVKTACPGGHIFHRSCLYRCFGDGCTADCPMCRQPIAKGDETPLPRPDETPPKRRRISGFNNREVAGMAGLVLSPDAAEAGGPFGGWPVQAVPLHHHLRGRGPAGGRRAPAAELAGLHAHGPADGACRALEPKRG
jgi:hypothetical protein